MKRSLWLKITCLGLVSAILLVSTGCKYTPSTDAAIHTVANTSNASGEAEDGVSLSSISLAVDPSDKLHPYKAVSLVNMNLMPLIYDSLVKLDASFQPQMVIAQSFQVNGLQYSIVTRDDLTFSDGSKLKPSDIVYSLNEAKKSPLYGARLQNISSVEAGKNGVFIKLKTADRHFMNCLDVPIVKEDSAAKDTDIPLGSGRYTVKTEGNKHTLIYNTRWYGEKKPKFDTIPLVTTPDDEAIISSVKTGNIALMMSDLSKGEIAGVGAATQPISLNNLIFIGLNANRGVLQDPEFRQALYQAIDQKTIMSKGYSGRGVATTLPTNPLFDLGEKMSGDDFPAYNATKAGASLDSLGYNKKDANGYRMKDEKPIELNLLVNATNQFKKATALSIQGMLKAVGLKVNIVESESFDAFKASVRKLDFDLYLGETKLLANMDISGFWQSGELHAGIKNDKELTDAYQAYRDKSGSYADFAKLFYKNTPFIPLMFRSGIVAYNKNIKGELSVTPSDIFANIENWT